MNMKKVLHALVTGSVAAMLALLPGCAAVYPEIGTNIHKVTGEQAMDPPPPNDLHWIRFKSAQISTSMRDGRTWQQALGKLPDPYAKLIVNDVEILKTNPQKETLEPTWNDSPRGNFRVSSQDKMRVEIWDANAVSDTPIGVKDFRATDDFVSGGQIRLEIAGAGEIVIAYEPAHAMFGLGLWYELRADSCFVTRMLEGSPAERAGVLPGDEVVEINGKKVQSMSANQVRSAFGAIPSNGLPIVAKHADGTSLTVTLREGPIYPPFDQFGQVD
jgi:membrane-associated protease RseP (regulator of RpoE activity)